MRFISKSFAITAGAAILSLGMIACHSQYPGNAGYMPTTPTALSAQQVGGGIEPLGKKGQIESACGHRLRIVIAGILNCRFHEKGYGDGTFTIVNHETGIVGVTPSSGTKATKFTVLGLVAGRGFFLVKDTKGNKYKVRVSVTL